jgi:hypothetical protein
MAFTFRCRRRCRRSLRIVLETLRAQSHAADCSAIFISGSERLRAAARQWQGADGGQGAGAGWHGGRPTLHRRSGLGHCVCPSHAARWSSRAHACAGGCCAVSCAAACCRAMTHARWGNGHIAAPSPSTAQCASRPPTALARAAAVLMHSTIARPGPAARTRSRAPALRKHETRSRRQPFTGPDSARHALPPRRDGAAAAHPPPSLLRRAGANGRSQEISAATVTGS